jgi:ankyrin repeat protein
MLNFIINKMTTLLNTFRYEEPDELDIYPCSDISKSGGFTYLMKLVMNPLCAENIDIFEYILQFFDEDYINKQNHIGWTALMLASRNSKTDSSEKTVKMLLDAGADVNLQNEDWTALMFASRYSNNDSSEKTVKMLLDAGADVNLQNKDGCTALMFASRYSNKYSSEKTVKMLLDAGVDVDLKNEDGWTALMLASRYSNNDSSEKTVKMLLDAGADVNLQNKDGCTALMFASRNSNKYSSEKTVKMLLDAGVDVDLKNNCGWTALMLASRYSNSDSSEKTVKMLLDAGADVNLQNEDGWTALIFASRNSKTVSSEKTVKMLLDADANVNLISTVSLQDKVLLLDYGFSLYHPKVKDIFGDEYFVYILPRIIYKLRMNGRIAGELIYKNNDIRFKPGSIGSKIVMLSYMYDKMTNKEWYKSLKSNGIKDYLSIIDFDDAVNKINQYLSYNSNNWEKR